MTGAARTGPRALDWIIPLLGLAVFFNYVDRGAVGIAAPRMTADLGLSPSRFGLIVSAFFWVYAPAQLFVGWLTDRLSVYRLMAGGVLLWAAATMLMGVAGGFVSLLVLRVLLGLGETIAFPGASKIIAQHVPAERRGSANAMLSLGLALGPAAGTLAGGAILGSFGWRAIFLVFGAVTLLWLLPWWWTTGHVSADRQRAADSVPLRTLLAKWPLWAMSVAHFASNYVFYFLLAWLPLFLTKSRGLSIAEMTLLATLGYAAQGAAALGFGWLSDRWGRGRAHEGRVRRAMMVGGQLLAAAAVIGLAGSDSRLAIGAWLCLAGIATGALSLNTYAVAQMFAGPRAVGSWVGVQNAIGNLSGIFGPIATGIIVERLGYGAAFTLTAAIAALGALWWVLAVPRIAEIAFD